MSYCRFSSMDFQCDLYVYDHYQGGTVIHVAKRRRVLNLSKLPPLDKTLKRREALMKLIREHEESNGEWVDVPWHGPDTYHVDTHVQAAALVAEMHAAGLIIPDGLEQDLLNTPDCVANHI